MAWEYDRAKKRINDLRQSVPTVNVIVENFAEDYYPRRELQRRANGQVIKQQSQPIIELPYRQAIVVDGVHIYARLLGYDDFLVSNGKETEESHRRALQLLHLHYSACDRLIERFDLQRVDYHGARLHAVVATPTGASNEPARVQKALEFSAALRRLVRQTIEQLGRVDLDSQFRIGVDSGISVAINDGRGIESDPLFLGPPANKAAKIAEDSDEPGIYLSDRAQALAAAFVTDGFSGMGYLKEASESEFLTRPSGLDQKVLSEDIKRLSEDLISDPLLMRSLTDPANFVFHQHDLPMRTLKFAELSPSNSVRMPLVSIFADLDRFSAYVDKCIAQNNIAEMVSNIHVIRGELTKVLKDDFNGKRVRYIGDCLHGEIASGTERIVNPEQSINDAVLCAGALRSSFNLCLEILELNDLGLAIGLEFGETPITRLGLRGDRSVRACSSIAVLRSEFEQKRCSASETAIGLAGYEAGSSKVQNLFQNDLKVGQLDYRTAKAYLTPSIISSQSSHQNQGARAHLE